MNKSKIEWQPCMETESYIRSHGDLHTGTETILITYETPTGKRHVKTVQCTNGRVTKTINGKIIAWQFLPAPYDGKPENASNYLMEEKKRHGDSLSSDKWHEYLFNMADYYKDRDDMPMWLEAYLDCYPEVLSECQNDR